MRKQLLFLYFIFPESVLREWRKGEKKRRFRAKRGSDSKNLVSEAAPALDNKLALMSGKIKRAAYRVFFCAEKK